MKSSNSKHKIISSFTKKIVETELINNSNSTTCGMIYQSKAPATLKKFSKVDNDK